MVATTILLLLNPGLYTGSFLLHESPLVTSVFVCLFVYLVSQSLSGYVFSLLNSYSPGCLPRDPLPL